jgi:hypothetical protein
MQRDADMWEVDRRHGFLQVLPDAAVMQSYFVSAIRFLLSPVALLCLIIALFLSSPLLLRLLLGITVFFAAVTARTHTRARARAHTHTHTHTHTLSLSLSHTHTH